MIFDSILNGFALVQSSLAETSTAARQDADNSHQPSGFPGNSIPIVGAKRHGSWVPPAEELQCAADKSAPHSMRLQRPRPRAKAWRHGSCWSGATRRETSTRAQIGFRQHPRSIDAEPGMRATRNWSRSRWRPCRGRARKTGCGSNEACLRRLVRPSPLALKPPGQVGWTARMEQLRRSPLFLP